MKKIIALLLVIALTAALSVSLTMAYLQDTDDDVNVMTLGNVYIEQHEYQRAVNADGSYKKDTVDGVESYVLESFKQGKPLYPIVGDPSSPDGYLSAGYDTIPVRMSQVGSYGGMDVFAGKNAQDKFVTVENTGKSDAYVRTLVALEIGTANADLIGVSFHKAWVSNKIGSINIAGNNYYLIEYVYNGAQLSDGTWRHGNGILPAGDTSYPNLSQVYLGADATNEDVAAIDGNKNGTYDIFVLSQAVQVEGFANAKTALDTAFGKPEEKAAEWFGGENFTIPTVTNVSTAEELTAAIAEGGIVVLEDDVVLEDKPITIATGTETYLNLNGHTIDTVADKTGNREMFLVKGNMTVTNGTINMEATNNQKWNAMTTVFDVTAGGELTISNATIENKGGTDMNFCVHLNNWGEVTLNIDNSTLNANYCAVRVFNSGYDMNNVTITNSTLTGGSLSFWVHNYIGDLDSNKHSDEAIAARLNFDIFNGTNTFNSTKYPTTPVRYGFDHVVWYDANGNVVTQP